MQDTKIKLENNEPREFMDASIARKLEVLGKEITDITLSIESRTQLNSALVNELKQRIKAQEIQISSFGGWNVGTIYETRIFALEREINELNKEIRFEEVGYWRDVSRLRETMRKVLKEYWQVQTRKEFLDKQIAGLSEIRW
ncbi:MAG: hypothetical protein FP824_07195 [Euryarchaeota archaeon]|nr:hypothetical protein [Euryarchaeota archaeon]